MFLTIHHDFNDKFYNLAFPESVTVTEFLITIPFLALLL